MYYASRVLQRLVLCMVVGATVVYWAMLIAITTSVTINQKLVNHQYTDTTKVNDLISRAIHSQSLVVLRWAIIAAVMTFAILLIKRYRKFEKRVVVDSVVIVGFCVVSVTFSQMLVRAFAKSLG